jgi:nucleotide-binding universal stress UspA family protein
MYTHILVPTDGSIMSNSAVGHAIRLAKQCGARITALHVISEVPPHLQHGGFATETVQATKKLFEEAETARANTILSAVKEAADKAGVKCDTTIGVGDAPYETIIKQANNLQCDLIVMASHGRRGLRGMLLGSETVRVLTHSKMPVLVCRE